MLCFVLANQGFCEDWDNEDNVEAMATACAASGTLASSVSDVGVAKALLDEKCGISLVSLLESERVELIHRCLVIVLELINAEDYGTQLATHLLECGIVPVLSNVSNFVMLANLGKIFAKLSFLNF